MRLYLDTEFNGFGGELISLALVSPDGDKFYMAKKWRMPTDPWVARHVLPILDVSPEDDILFRTVFHEFIGRFKNPTIFCDWHADAEHFCAMLSGADYGSSLDFPCTIGLLKTPPGQPVSARPHNALADAIALMQWHESLRQVA
jgi:hypothetical protein